MQPMSQGEKSPLYISKTRIIAEVVVIITAAFVLGSVSIVHGAIKQLIKAMRYWIWIAKIRLPFNILSMDLFTHVAKSCCCCGCL
jgi:hypothetical protein